MGRTNGAPRGLPITGAVSLRAFIRKDLKYITTASITLRQKVDKSRVPYLSFQQHPYSLKPGRINA